MTEKIQSESEAAHLFRKEYGEQVRFVPERSMWMIKDGSLWVFDEAKGIEALIRELLDRQSDADMSLLCAGCHRFIHKLIAVKKRWVSIAEAAKDFRK